MYYQIVNTSCLSHIYNYLKTNKHITYPIENNIILKIKQYPDLDFFIIIHKNSHYYYCENIESFIQNINNYYLDNIFQKDRDQFINLCNIVDTFKEDDDDEYIINVMKGYDNFKNRVQHPFYMTDEFEKIEYNFDIFTLLK